MLKKLPLGIQTFKSISEEGYLYIDKTPEIFRLIDQGKYYFLSRPRRFGKSLLVSTLKSLFLGQKELFKSLWIYDKIEWKQHPIIQIDFSLLSFTTSDELKESLSKRVVELAEQYELHLSAPLHKYKDCFKELIIKLSKQGKVVILIDEYDKPLIDFIGDSTALENRQILKNFYGVLKGLDPYIQFVFLTGVSKFSKVSIFSDLNNLTDMTLDKRFATLAGYTESELVSYFNPYIDVMAQQLKTTTHNLLNKIKLWYNGYSWDGTNFVYNPYSILSFFVQKQFNNYWFQSGTPTFLIKLIKEHDFKIEHFESYRADNSVFDSYDIDRMTIPTLLFQTGYLTIKEVEELDVDWREYILSYPNLEVKESLLRHILMDFSQIQTSTGVVITKLGKSLAKNDLEGFMELLKGLFSEIPSHLFIKDREAYYHTIIYLVLTLLGVRVAVEVHTNKGRIDAVIQTQNHIYIIEFKLGTAQEALKQIQDKTYYERYLPSDKQIVLVGISFDVEERNVKEFLVQSIKGELCNS